MTKEELLERIERLKKEALMKATDNRAAAYVRGSTRRQEEEYGEE